MPSAQQLKRKFRRKELLRKILKGLLLVGAVYLAAGSSIFALNLMRRLTKTSLKNLNKREKKQISDTFTYLRKKELLEMRIINRQLYIKLTPAGKKLARQYQIDELEISKPKEWDGQWRVLMFDIPENVKLKREALRGKLKQLGLTMLQRSIWVHPYPCQEELKFLNEFFGLTDKHCLVIETSDLGRYTTSLKRIYNL